MLRFPVSSIESNEWEISSSCPWKQPREWFWNGCPHNWEWQSAYGMWMNFEMFLRMQTVHCDRNNSYEITINGYQVRKINKIRNIIFGLSYGKPSSVLRSKLECSPSWVHDAHQDFINYSTWWTTAITLRKVSHSVDRKIALFISFIFLTW